MCDEGYVMFDRDFFSSHISYLISHIIFGGADEIIWKSLEIRGGY